jgi:hypothetical protein
MRQHRPSFVLWRKSARGGSKLRLDVWCPSARAALIVVGPVNAAQWPRLLVQSLARCPAGLEVSRKPLRRCLLSDRPSDSIVNRGIAFCKSGFFLRNAHA